MYTPNRATGQFLYEVIHVADVNSLVTNDRYCSNDDGVAIFRMSQSNLGGAIASKYVVSLVSLPSW